MKLFLFLTFAFCFYASPAQDSLSIKVHFLYGSKPHKKYKDVEKKWFGGMLGGHVGIEDSTNRIYSFEGRGRHHIFGSKKNKHSIYRVVDSNQFWNIMGTPGDSVKKLTITIPVKTSQAQKLDSITSSYLAVTPYDYAVFGMRCGASTYEILAQLDILRQYSHFRTYMKIFYPRRLRKRLIARAEQFSWNMSRQEGTNRRKWEKDVN